MSYIPVVIGEAAGLRYGVEAILDGNEQDAVAERLLELDQTTQALGLRATFGAEIEYEFASDPSQPSNSRSHDKEDLYEQIVHEVQGTMSVPTPGKGQIVWPNEYRWPILVNPFVGNTYNPDQPDSDISEIRTAPAGPLESVDRYWHAIDAIGTIAARHGLMAMILSTHISTAVTHTTTDKDGGRYEQMLFSGDQQGSQYLAATQYNINALRLLQLDAGLEPGVVVSEAFPHSKDASTTVHGQRLEFRHPIIGVADPRIDVLASLAGLTEVGTDTIPQSAIDKLRLCRGLEIYDFDPWHYGLESIAVVDDKTSRLAVPMQLETTARDVVGNSHIDRIVETVTEGRYTTFDALDGQVLRDIIRSMRVGKNNRILVNGNSEFAGGIREAFANRLVQTKAATSRVLPHITYESPSTHIERRSRLKHSPAVRRVFGSALSAVIPASEAASRRQELLDTQVVISNPDLDD